jgi:hypothetical protein
MSDMARARELMDLGMQKMEHAQDLIDEANDLFKQARRLSIRASPVRRAPHQVIDITDDMRDKVETLAQNKKLTMHDIARRVGLRNGGRVSELLTGKR